MMEAASTSESSADFYQTTRRYNPEDNHLHTRRRESLKSYVVPQFFTISREIINTGLQFFSCSKLLCSAKLAVVIPVTVPGYDNNFVCK
jgi:hypothetical protein